MVSYKEFRIDLLHNWCRLVFLVLVNYSMLFIFVLFLNFSMAAGKESRLFVGVQFVMFDIH